VLTVEDLERLGGFARYRDVDGDAIAGARCPERATQGRLLHPRSGHNDAAIYTRIRRVSGADGAAGAEV